MVKIIEDRFDAKGAPYLVFRVYKEHDSGEVKGYVIPRSDRGEDGQVKVVKTDKNLPPEEGLKRAVEAAKEHGFEYVLVHDLDHLFPREKWPALQEAA